MVTDTGKAPHADAFKPVAVPGPVKVEEDVADVPLAVCTPRRQPVEAVTDRWRIDDEWWRRTPVSRFYYTVILASGLRLVLYKDLLEGKWYRQG